MSTSEVIPLRFLTAGVDILGRRIDGNVVIGILVEVTDPDDVPLGGLVELGTWGEALWIEDPGGRRLRTLGGDDGDDLELDPPVDDDPAGPGDLFHLDAQYAEPALAA